MPPEVASEKSRTAVPEAGPPRAVLFPAEPVTDPCAFVFLLWTKEWALW